MSQITINIGAVPNDGTGDPLRTAFNDVNLNFDQVFAAGPVLSNVQIANNTILTTNTNGNLVLAPNGTGVVQSNVSLVPDQNRIRNLGSANRLWDTTYTQYLQTAYANIGTANISNIGLLTIPVANLHILGGTNGYVLQTDGTGNLSWTAQTGGGGNGVPGGANTQVQFNDAGAFGGAAGFTFNKTANALAVGGNITGGNLYTGGIVSASGNVSGNNIIASGVVSATGNVRGGNINTTGAVSVSGNVISGNTFTNSITLKNTDDFAQIVFSSDGGATNNGQIKVDGGTNMVVSAASNYYVKQAGSDRLAITNTTSELMAGTNVVIQSNKSGTANTWIFDTTGTLTFPDNSGDGWPVNTQRFGMGNIGAWLDGQWTIGEFSGNGVSGEFGIRIDPGIEGNTGITIPSQAGSTTQPVSIYNTGGGGIELYTGANNWYFKTNGITQFPGNILQAPDGVPFDIKTTNGNAYSEIYSDAAVQAQISINDQLTGAYPAWAVIEADMANVNTPSAAIILKPGDTGTEVRWTFDKDGNLTIPGSILGSGNLYIAPDANNLGGRLDIFLTYGPDIHIAGVGENLILGRDDGANVTVGANGTVTIQADTGTPQLWNFGYTGNLTVPGNIVTTDHGFQFTSDISNVTVSGGNVYVETVDNVFGGPSTGQVVISGVTGTTQANGTWWYTAVDNNAFQLYTSATIATPVNGTGWSTYVSGGTAVAGVPADISITANGNSWTFGANGSVIFPTLTVDLHNGGNTPGQTLQFGDPNQQAFITGPTPPTGQSAQRLIIQGQNGGTGEGGDVYVWGGDSQFNGGDIKIYAGDADNGASGQGGNIHISGGKGQNPGGEISLTGGQTYNGSGAPVVVTGGRGSTTGGALSLNGGYGDIDGGTITLTAGYGTATGGNVDIIGGISGNGLGYYGNVNINAGASAWHFDNAGVLTVPGNINTNGHQVLGGSGNLDLNIDGAVGLAAGTGLSVVLTASGHNWTFDNGGDLTVPGNSTIGTPIATGGAGGNSVTIRAGSSDTFASAPGGDLGLFGGYGSFGDGGGPPGGNVVIASGLSYDSHPGNVSVNTGSNQWLFDYSGNLTLPQGGVVYETNIPFGGLSGKTIALKPDGGTSADQQLLVYPTAGADANHLHLTSGNLYNTELFLGNDDLYVKLANTGDIVINSNDGGGNTAQWNFGTDGNLTTPGSSGNITGANVVSAVTFSATGVVKTGVFVTGNILGAATVGAGARAFVTDADIRTWGNLYVGGAGNAVPVWSDGSNWYIG